MRRNAWNINYTDAEAGKYGLIANVLSNGENCNGTIQNLTIADSSLTVALKDVGSGTVIYFETAKAAKEAKKDLLANLDDDSDVSVKISGKVVFIGEKDLWKKI